MLAKVLLSLFLAFFSAVFAVPVTHSGGFTTLDQHVKARELTGKETTEQFLISAIKSIHNAYSDGFKDAHKAGYTAKYLNPLFYYHAAHHAGTRLGAKLGVKLCRKIFDPKIIEKHCNLTKVLAKEGFGSGGEVGSGD